MTVYIEYVFASNFVFDFALLLALSKIAKLIVAKKRLFFATLFGTAIAIVLPLANLGVLLSVFAKLLLSVGILIVLGGCKSKRHFFVLLILFWSLTFGMGGVMLGIYFLTKTDFALQQDLSVVSNSPVPLFVAGLLIFGFLVKSMVDFVNAKKTNSCFERQVKIVVGKFVFCAKGFLDSGNQLCDNQSGLPVVIVTSQKLKAFFANKLVAVDGEDSLLKNVHYVKFATLAGGVQKMIAFGVDRVEIDKKCYDVLIALSKQKVCFDCDLLLNAKMGL